MNSNYIFLNTRLGSQFNRKKLEQSERDSSFSSNFLSLTWLSSLALMLSFLMGQGAMAQVSTYTFSQSSGTYTPITGGTLAASGAGLDDTILSVILPTSFNYNGTTITTVGFSPNGYLIMGNANTHGYIPISNSTTSSGIIAALGTDLVSASATSELRWQQIGDEIIFQWKEFKRYNSTPFTNESVSFQIRLNTLTRSISNVYDGSASVNASIALVPQVGLRGTTNSDYNARRLTTSVPDSSPAWNDTAAATSNAHNVRFTSTSIAAFPSAGLTFTWTPLVLSPCVTPSALPTGLSFSAVTTTSLNGSFTAASPAPSKYLVVRSTSAIAPTPSNGTVYTVGSTTLGAGTNVRLASNATTFSDSGLTSGTQYYYYIFSYNDLCTGEPFYSATALSGSQNTLCATGTSLGSNTITQNSANITWTGSGNYIVEYGLSGFTPGTGATAGAGGTIASSVATSPYALSGLLPSTTYQVYVRQVCPLGGYSLNSSSTSFTTACAAFDAPTTVEPFASAVPPSNCWSRNNGLLGASTTLTSSTAWILDDYANVTSPVNNAARINIFGTSRRDWLISPSYNLGTGGEYQLEFDLALTAFGATTPATLGVDDKFAVVISTDNGVTWSNANILQQWTSATPIPNGLGTHVIISLASYTGTVRIGFYGESTISNVDNDLFIDNVVVSTIPVLPPNCATALIPGDLATNVIRNSSISWSAATGGPTSYDVYFGTSSNPSLVANVTALSYTPAVMAANTTYYWKIVPKNNNGDAVGCVEQSFTTGSDLNYCASVPTSNDALGITQVVLGTTTVSIPDVTYQNNTATVVSVNQGATLNTQITFATGFTYDTNIWIDFNDNGSFADAGELVYTGVSLSANPTTLNATFTIPMSATLGAHRMRIGTADSGQVPPNPCYSDSYGVTLDFTVQVNPMPTDTPDYVNLQFPGSATILLGESATVYARVYEGGLTNTTSGQAPGIEAWIGISPIGADASSNPNTWTTWVPATFNVETDGNNNDEYQATIGSTLPIGTYRYASRFRLNGGPFVYGGYEFNEWNGTSSISGVLTVNPNPTQCATLISPVNGATNVPVGSLTLTWAAPTSGPTPTGYKLYAGTTSGSLSLVTTVTGLTTNVIISGFETTFYWQIVPTSGIGGDAVGCGEFSFTTEIDPFVPYCSGVNYSDAIEPITLVNFAGINNTSSNVVNGSASLENFIAVTGNVTAGQSYSMTLKGNTDGPFNNNFRVFVDWNQDGDFDDAGETYNAGSIYSSTGLDAVQAVSNIVVPANASAGSTRMRVKKLFGTTDINNPCLGFEYGQTEDYTLIVSRTWYQDLDGDTYGNDAVTTVASAQPDGYVAVGGDCNDNANTIYPGATEICYDGILQNCNGDLNDGCPVVLTQIRPYFCGTTLQFVNSSILANTPTGLPNGATITGYRYEITNLSTTAVREVEKTIAMIRINETDIAGFNTAYSIRVMVRINNEWQDYGIACTILTPAIPTTAVSTVCGQVLPSLQSTIYATTVVSSTGYEFEVSRMEGGVAVETTTIERSVNNFKLTLLSGIQYVYASEYQVRVRVKANVNGIEGWSNYGAVCSVYTPEAPEAAIDGCGGEQGIAPAALNTPIYATPLTGATQYRFTLSDGVSYNQVYTTSARFFRLSTFNALQTLTPGGQYSVTVEAEIYGYFYAGKDCNILVPGGAAIRSNPIVKAEETIKDIPTDFKAVAYPNPFANSFAVDVRTSNTEKVSLTVYDMAGRLLEVKEVNASEVANYQFGDRYPSGVYNMIVTQGEETRTVRVVKQ
ncbi:GEVED domain-containing protein [Flavobacterium azooxidireducens]|uniref:GEVED domain-containing protein n=1 Tax=Flavobacterium azooxidireducens TaxID=1871076 RepID=A0ABY4KIU7_9FLAO|nr:GEVED domain-containing protein [Flavobacterium azooxidireducens]UPQ80769.1 GEVED domain-containing protein [Flavobacterium azooxidireducens]